MDGSSSRIPRVTLNAPPEPAEIATDSPWSVRVDSFHTASGLLTSFTVYRVAWTGPGPTTGIVEHRYSDFLSLHAHLVKVFPPSRYQYQAFPEKKRFVLLSERDDVAAERLKHFQSYCSLFAMYPEVWDDPKVQRFFDLPRELRGKAGSLRHAQSSLSPRNKHSGGDDAKAGSNSPALLQALHRAKASPTSPPESGGVHRSDSNMFISSNLSSRDREALRPEELDAIVRSGSDMYLSSILGEEDRRSPRVDELHSPLMRRASKKNASDELAAFRSSHLASMEASASQSPLLMRRESPRTDLESPRRKGDLRDSNQMRTARFSSDAIPGLNTDSPLLRHKSDTTAQNSPRRKDSADVPPRRHPSGERRGSMENGNDSTTFNTPPSKPGDVSPVFARKDKEAVHVPRNMQADSRIRCLKDFQLHALIGRGGFGSVFLATEHATGLVVAVKRMAKRTLVKTSKVEQIKMEVTILKLARVKQNRWIVQLHYSFQDEHYLYLCMQFCPGGDLRHLMDNCEMDELTARAFASEMCMCVHQLHALGYAHRDLKPDNFLVSQRGHLKLADFGLSEKGYQSDPRLRTRTRGKSDGSMPGQGAEDYSYIIVYFPPSAAEVRPVASRRQGLLDAMPSSGSIDGMIVTESSPKDRRRSFVDSAGSPVAAAAGGGTGGGGGGAAAGGGVVAGSAGSSSNETAAVEEHGEDDDNEDVFTLLDEKGRRYKRVKVFVSHSTTCSDVIDTIKHKLDIRRQVPYQLVEIAFINGHHHERIVKPDELVETLYASFELETFRHKFVFRRIGNLALRANRSMTQLLDSRPAPELSSSRMKLFSVVGSPHYMAREILAGTGYESVVDWWSIGCIIYEMLYSASPFDAATPEGVFSRILSFNGVLQFPAEPAVSDRAKDLISRFISPPEKRLGARGGLDEVMTHAFFEGVQWGELQYSDPPFLPELDSPLDIGYFPSATSDGVERYTQQSAIFDSAASSTTTTTTTTTATTSTASTSSMRASGDASAGEAALDETKLWSDFDWSWFS